jgi:Ca2+-binding RTX toxin-like protein
MASDTDTTGHNPTSHKSSVIQDQFEFSYTFNTISFQATARADDIKGDNSANTLFGLGGADTIDARRGADTIDGGAGKDTLTGGSGNDKFVFDTKLGASNVDTITDFTHNHDRIVIDLSVFAELAGPGALDADAFAANTAGAAHTAQQHILYSTKTGALSYDADGSGTLHTAIQFATLHGAPTLDAGDFIVT